MQKGRLNRDALFLSPRGRGTHRFYLPFQLTGWVIPAWAGNRESSKHSTHKRSGHPRVGGEQYTSAISPLVSD